jgi:hypothetical protein
MKINNQDVDINDLVSDRYMHKEVKKGIYLSDYQVEVLNNYGINIDECGSINDLIMLIDEVLEDDIEADDLEQISKEISEFNYYTNINK